jgi:hypothetical protein
MKKLLLVVVLVAACLAMFAAPASAFYAPQQNTAYIPHWMQGAGWLEWAPDNPYGIIEHYGEPIPNGMNVVVTVEWFDSRLGATLIPAEWFHTMAISSSNGTRFAITKAACGLRYWSPAYRWADPNDDPLLWARDWWVPLGKLHPGDYTGWIRGVVPRAFPTWIDQDTGAWRPLCSPYKFQPEDVTENISFTVAP